MTRLSDYLELVAEGDRAQAPLEGVGFGAGVAPVSTAKPYGTATPAAQAAAEASAALVAQRRAENAARERAAAEAARIDQDMWTRAGRAPWIVEWMGRYVSRDANRTFRVGDDRTFLTCDWTSLVLNATCTDENVFKWLMPVDQFAWARLKLAHLLDAKPLMPGYTATTAGVWAQWVFDVMRYVSVAYWAIGIRPYQPTLPGPTGTMASGIRAPRTWLAWEGPAWLRFRDRVDVATRGVTGVSTVASMPKPDFGVLGLKLWDFTNPVTNLGRMRPSTLVNNASEYRIPASRQDFDPIVRTYADSGTSPNDAFGIPIGPRVTVARLGQAYAEGPSRWNEGVISAGTPQEVLRQWMALTAYLPATTVDRPLLVGRKALVYYNAGNNTRGRRPEFVPTLAGQGIIEFADALARDVALASYDGVVLESLTRWKADMDLMPEYARQGWAGLSTAVAQAAAASRDAARAQAATASTVYAVIGTIGSAVPVVAAAMAIVQLAQTLIIEYGDMVTGASAIPFCNPSPFLRTMTQASCDLSAVMRRLEGRVLTPVLTVAAPTAPVAPTTTKKSSSALWLGAAALAAVAFASRRK